MWSYFRLTLICCTASQLTILPALWWQSRNPHTWKKCTGCWSPRGVQDLHCLCCRALAVGFVYPMSGWVQWEHCLVGAQQPFVLLSLLLTPHSCQWHQSVMSRFHVRLTPSSPVLTNGSNQFIFNRVSLSGPSDHHAICSMSASTIWLLGAEVMLQILGLGRICCQVLAHLGLGWRMSAVEHWTASISLTFPEVL